MKLQLLEIQNHLNTRLIGKNIIWKDEVSSTNDIALELASKGASEGMVVLSESQTLGKGRAGRSWYSPPGGGIYLSIILKPVFSPLKAYQLTFLAAVAAAETLNNLLNLEVRVKWPNDLMIRNKKLGGVLTELKAEMDRIHYAVVGIGINVNVTEFPEELRNHVTSLALELCHPIQRTILIQNVLRSLERWYFILLEENSEPTPSLSRGSSLLFETWRFLSCTLGKQIEIKTGKGIIRGLATRVESDGSLYVREDSGEEQQVVTGDIVEVSKVPKV